MNNGRHGDALERWRRRRLVELLEALAVREGDSPTSIPGVEILRASAPRARHPVAYQPKIMIVGQGCQLGYVGEKTYRYDAENYVVLTVPLPFECQTVATPGEPLLGVTVQVDLALLGQMLVEMDEAVPPRAKEGGVLCCICSTPLTADLRDSVIRLLECLRSPLDSRVLGPQVAREVVYRVLCGKLGGVLRALAQGNEHFPRIARVLHHIHADYARPLTIQGMAQRAGMGATAFHESFKRITATSPLQYVKQVRLHRARTLMAHDGCTASAAAMRVGYESASQFGREFKRFFGVPPGRDARDHRQR